MQISEEEKNTKFSDLDLAKEGRRYASANPKEHLAVLNSGGEFSSSPVRNDNHLQFIRYHLQHQWKDLSIRYSGMCLSEDCWAS